MDQPASSSRSALTDSGGLAPANDVTEAFELARIRGVYARRSASGRQGRYSALAPGALLEMQQVERLLLGYLAERGVEDLADLEILDVGCGTGGELTRLVSYGADPTKIHGIDLREEPIEVARMRLPQGDITVGNAAELPYADASMDLVMQFTMMSSIRDPVLRGAVAAEFIRVVRPRGVIVSYDFRLNPVNRATRGINSRELRRLFPRHDIQTKAATLAPPVQRFIAARSASLAAVLTALPVMRTHLLAFITAPPSAVSMRS